MKRMQLLVMAIMTALIFSTPVASSSGAEETKKKTSTYSERLSKKSEANSAGTENTKKEEEVARYPLATRVPKFKVGEPSLAKLRNQMITSLQKGKKEEAQEAADKLEKEAKANANDRAIALQVKLILQTEKDNGNHAVAIPLLEETISLDALSNNDHYGMMHQLAQRYLADTNYQNALDIANRFISETKAETKEILAVKANALYRLKRVQESIPVLEKVNAMDSSDGQVAQMLARAYADSGQLQKAALLTKTLAQSTGNDRATKINLAITYRDAKQFEKAAEVIAELRASQQLVEERDYLTAMNIYSAMKNHEGDMVSVVQEGLSKGVLKPTASNFNVLAESYYYTDRTKEAIANWTKAAPLSKDGRTYLNLAIVQCQEEMWAACKESAKNAIAKGGIDAKDSKDAKSQIAMADKGLENSR